MTSTEFYYDTASNAGTYKMFNVNTAYAFKVSDGDSTNSDITALELFVGAAYLPNWLHINLTYTRTTSSTPVTVNTTMMAGLGSKPKTQVLNATNPFQLYIPPQSEIGGVAMTVTYYGSAYATELQFTRASGVPLGGMMYLSPTGSTLPIYGAPTGPTISDAKVGIELDTLNVNGSLLQYAQSEFKANTDILSSNNKYTTFDSLPSNYLVTNQLISGAINDLMNMIDAASLVNNQALSGIATVQSNLTTTDASISDIQSSLSALQSAITALEVKIVPNPVQYYNNKTFVTINGSNIGLIGI